MTLLLLLCWLLQALLDAGYAINTDHFYTAGYDSPFRLTNRHNEVWILAQKPASRSSGRQQQQGEVSSS